MWDQILNLLSSTSVVIFIAGIMVIAFARSIIRIFRMGAQWKTEFATRQEQREFEAEIRKDMRNYAVQIQKAVTDAVMVVIEQNMKDIESSKEIYTEMQVMKAELEVEMKNALEKVDTIKATEDSVRALKNRVDRLEFRDSNSNSVSTDRRKI